MTNFVKRLRQTMEDNPDFRNSRITVSRADLRDLIWDHTRLDNEHRARHKVEHPECYPPTKYTGYTCSECGWKQEETNNE